MKIPTVARPTYIPIIVYLKNIQLFIILSERFLGARSMISPSTGLKLKAVAGRPSVTKLTHNNYIELRPSGTPRMHVMKIETTSPILLEIIYRIKAFILAYIALPSSIAVTMVAKLSSMRIKSLACLATSVPFIPMAMPIDAYLNAGASLTPSPVIATTSFILTSSLTIRRLFSGLEFAKIRHRY